MVKKILPVKGCPVYCESSLNVDQTLFNPLARDLRGPIMCAITFRNGDCLIVEGLLSDPFF